MEKRFAGISFRFFVGALLLLIPVFCWLLPSAYLFIYDGAFYYGPQQPPNALVGYCMRNRFQFAEITIAIGILACGSALLPLRTINSKKRSILFVILGAIFLAFIGFIVPNGMGVSGSSVLSDGLNFLLHDSISHFLLEMIICLCLAGTIITAIYFRVVRKILCGLCCVGVVWGSVVAVLACSMLQYSARYLLGASYSLWLIWAGIMCLSGWLKPMRQSRVMALTRLLLHGYITVSFAAYVVVGGNIASITLTAVFLAISLICLIIDTVFVFLSHRKAAIPAAPGDPPAPTEE